MRNNITKHLNLILAAIFTINFVYARDIRLSGRILFDDDSTSIATIELIEKLSGRKDTTLSNPDNGYFLFHSVKPEHVYQVVCSSMGYQTDTLNLNTISDHTHLGEIRMKPNVQILNEVIVSADMVESFASRENIMIPLSIKDHASSGYDAIRQLPQFSENMIYEKLITSDRKSIKILINGIESTENDLKILGAKEIVRIQYFSNPPVRYSNLGIGAVINVITSSNRISGLDLLINTKNSVTTGSGSDIVDMKFYNNNNQFNVGYSFDYRNMDDNLINQDYSYEINDTHYKNYYKGISGLYKGEMHVVQLGYIHNKKNDFLFSAKGKARFNPGDEKYKQQTYVSVNDQPLIDGFMNKELKSSYQSYNGDIYLNKQFKNNQEIIANFVATYYSSFSKNKLQRNMDNPDYNFYYLNNTDNTSWSVIGEALYNKRFGKHELTTGIRFFNKQLKQTYNQISQSDILQQIYYVYAGLNGRFSDLDYSLEIGAENSHNKLTGNERVRTNFTSVNPSLSLNYHINKKSNLKFINRAYGNVPEISMLTSNPVYLNYNYLSVGNPALKPYYIFQGELKYQLSGSGFLLNTGLNYNYSFKPFVSSFVEYSDYIYKTWAYKDNRSYIGYSMNMRWMPWKWIALQAYLALGYTEVEDKSGFKIDDFTKLASFSASFTYKKFRLLTQVQSIFSNLYGDYLEKTGVAFTGELSYILKSFNFGLQYIHNPNPMQLISKSQIMHLKEETIWGDYRNLIMLKAVWRFSVGKKSTIPVNQRITNSDNDSGLREDAKAR